MVFLAVGLDLSLKARKYMHFFIFMVDIEFIARINSKPPTYHEGEV
jgi:hypothetical protein